LPPALPLFPSPPLFRSTRQIERGARGEPPRQPELQLGAEISGIALHPTLIVHGRTVREGLLGSEDDRRVRVDLLGRPCRAGDPRSEEHTSELQSLTNLV